MVAFGKKLKEKQYPEWQGYVMYLLYIYYNSFFYLIDINKTNWFCIPQPWRGQSVI